MAYVAHRVTAIVISGVQGRWRDIVQVLQASPRVAETTAVTPKRRTHVRGMNTLDVHVANAV